MKFENKKNSGFTLVEMMVAIAVFSIVMVTAMSALLNVIDANNKARAIKTAINNVSFALEGISKDMRMGTNYLCGSDLTSALNNKNSNGVDCVTGGGTVIGYRSPRADVINNVHGYAFYEFTTDGKIKECLEKSSIICATEGDFNPITSEEVTIATSSRFYVVGSNDPVKQPRMIMTLSGEAGTKAKIKTTFDLQTSVSQRIRPEQTP